MKLASRASRPVGFLMHPLQWAFVRHEDFTEGEEQNVPNWMPGRTRLYPTLQGVSSAAQSVCLYVETRHGSTTERSLKFSLRSLQYGIVVLLSFPSTTTAEILRFLEILGIARKEESAS